MSNPWTSRSTPLALSTPPSPATASGAASPPRQLTLAEIQARGGERTEETKGETGSDAAVVCAASRDRRLRSLQAAAVRLHPLRLLPAPSLPPLLLAAPAKAWKVSSNTSPPSSSLRVIQDEERERSMCLPFSLPTAAKGASAAASGKKAAAVPSTGSVVWGRADVMGGAVGQDGCGAAVRGDGGGGEETGGGSGLLRAVEAAQEREREEEQRRQQREQEERRSREEQ